MVGIAPDTSFAEELLRKKVPVEDDWSDEIRKAAAIPKHVRLEIPLTDRYSLRYVADYLRGLANSLDLAARRTDIPTRMSIVDVMIEVQQTNQKIKATTKSGAGK